MLTQLPLTLGDAWDAAEMAGFADDIKQMPMGMHTVLPEELLSFLVYGAALEGWRILLTDHHQDHSQQRLIRHVRVYAISSFTTRDRRE